MFRRFRGLGAGVILCLASLTADVTADQGADIAVSEMTTLLQFGREGSVIGCALRSRVCNVGVAPLDWFSAPDTNHPFIVSNLYRLRDGRFQQIGQSWAKHGFGAEQSNTCGMTCLAQPNNNRLGVGCSDTYTASFNSIQSFMGPRSEINPWTGGWTWKGSHLQTDEGPHDGIDHRLQVHDDDLDPLLNVGAEYFAELYFVAHDDADPLDSIAREPVAVSGTPGGSWSFNLSATATEHGPAIELWPGASTSVIAASPTDGRAYVAVTTQDNGDGTWRYEYAVYNLDLDRGIGSFVVPVASSTQVTNTGFSAVASHGEPYDNDPWTSDRTASTVAWATVDYGTDPFANPIRWGTMYNFWFDADAEPATTTLTLGLYKPGAPAALSGASIGPAFEVPGDVNSDGIVDILDLLAVVLGWGPCPAEPDPCNADVNDTGCVDVLDLVEVLLNWT